MKKTTKPRKKTIPVRATASPTATTPRRPAHRPVADPDVGYPELLAGIRGAFYSATTIEKDASRAAPVLFRVPSGGLFTMFLESIPHKNRQHYNCHACREFIENYGGVVRILPTGGIVSAIWDPSLVAGPFEKTVSLLMQEVMSRSVTSVFASKHTVWGRPVTGEWTHLSLIPDPSFVHRETPLENTGQFIARKNEEFQMLFRSVNEFPLAAARRTRDLLQVGDLYRGQKHLPMAEWFLQLHESLVGPKTAKCRHNLIRRAAASAPAGWCHLRGGVLGVLLADVKEGMPVDMIRRKHGAIMAPLQYLRPTAQPTGGQIDAAEKVVEKLGIERSLRRRFATIGEIRYGWLPSPGAISATVASPGPFSSLRQEQYGGAGSPVNVTNGVTWATFVRKVLPVAARIQCVVPYGRTGFGAMVTAYDQGAPPILRWDHLTPRNPVSSYVYVGGSPAQQWNLWAGQPTDVLAIAPSPEQWHSRDHGSEELTGAPPLLVLTGARDMSICYGGLFPEDLKSELHGSRAVIEAYTRKTPVSPAPPGAQHAAGLFVNGGACPITLIVTTRSGMTAKYVIDRWE